MVDTIISQEDDSCHGRYVAKVASIEAEEKRTFVRQLHRSSEQRQAVLGFGAVEYGCRPKLPSSGNSVTEHTQQGQYLR